MRRDSSEEQLSVAYQEISELSGEQGKYVGKQGEMVHSSNIHKHWSQYIQVYRCGLR